MFATIFFYALGGAAIGAVSMPFLDDFDGLPEGGLPAFAALIGLFWPLAIVAGLGYGLCRAGVVVARSFAVLWRAWRPRRVPRAVARERGGR